MVFHLVGLGLGDEADITVKGLALVKRAKRVLLERCAPGGSSPGARPRARDAPCAAACAAEGHRGVGGC